MSESIIISAIILFYFGVNHISCQDEQEQDLFNSTTNNLTMEEGKPIIELYTFPFIILIGTVCNILTFLVMRRKKMRHQSTYFYMAVLAIADEMVILVGCLNFWIYAFFNTSLILTPYGCKIMGSLLYATSHYSVWIVVIMTIERFIAVALPLQASQLCTVRRAQVACLILALIVFSINCHFIFTHKLINDECVHSTEYNIFMDKVWPWIDAIIYSFVPLSILIIFNILIVHNLIKASKNIQKLQNKSLNINSTNRNNNNNNNKYFQCFKQQKCFIFLLLLNKRKTTTNDFGAAFSADSLPLSNRTDKTSNHVNNNTNNNTNSSSANRRLTIMLLVVSITFFITSVPIVTLQTIERTFKSNYSLNHFNILKGIFLALQYLNHSINFFLYAVTGKTFRREFFALFGFNIKKRKQNNINFNTKMINNRKKNVKKFTNSTVISEYSIDNNNVIMKPNETNDLEQQQQQVFERTTLKTGNMCSPSLASIFLGNN